MVVKSTQDGNQPDSNVMDDLRGEIMGVKGRNRNRRDTDRSRRQLRRQFRNFIKGSTPRNSEREY